MSGADDTTSAFKRFQNLAKRLTAVPKREAEAERHKEAQARGVKPARG